MNVNVSNYIYYLFPDIFTNYVPSFLVAEEEAPSGLLARGSYQATTKFVDDDKVVHLQFPWSFEIKKVWA